MRGVLQFADTFLDDINGISAVEIKKDGGVVYDQSMRLDGQILSVSSVEERNDYYRYNLSTPLKPTRGDKILSSFCGSTR
jgi:hypothetical protein